MALPSQQKQRGLLSSYLSQRPTMPLSTNATPLSFEEPSISPDAPTIADPSSKPGSITPQKKQSIMRFLAIGLVLVLAIGLYVIWSPTSTATTPPPITQQNFGPSTGANQGTTDTTNHNTTSGGSIQVYIVGAVKRPGVYILAGKNSTLHNSHFL